MVCDIRFNPGHHVMTHICELPHHHLYHHIPSSSQPPQSLSTWQMPTQGQATASLSLFEGWSLRTSVKMPQDWRGAFSFIIWSFSVFGGAFWNWTSLLLGLGLILTMGSVFVLLEPTEEVELGLGGEVPWIGSFLTIFWSFSMFGGAFES